VTEFDISFGFGLLGYIRCWTWGQADWRWLL